MNVDSDDEEGPKRRGAPRNQFKETQFFEDEEVPEDLLLPPVLPPRSIPEPRFDIADAFAEKMRAYATYSKQKRLEERARVEEERVKAAKEAIRMAQEKVTVIAKEVKQRKLENTVTEGTKAESEPAQEQQSLRDLIAAGENIPTVRKQNFFVEGLSDMEQQIINERVKLQQMQYAEYERRETARKIRIIWEVHPSITEEEAKKTLKDSGDDEEEAINKLTDFTYLKDIRIEIAKLKTPAEDAGDEDGEDEEPEKKKTRRVRKKPPPKKEKAEDGTTPNGDDAGKEDGDGASSGKAAESGSGNSGEDSDDDGAQFETRTHKKKKIVSIPKLRLDDAVAQVQQVGSQEGWSAARIRAWNLRVSNPNAYYYRFNDPGEEQRNGKWTDDEKRLFFKRMAENGVNGQWGMFAKHIPGRVGYQCANFYRQLIENGEIVDERYVIDEDGKAHFLFSKGIVKKKKKRKAGEDADDAQDESGGEGAPPSKKAKTSGSAPRPAPKRNAIVVYNGKPLNPPQDIMEELGMDEVSNASAIEEYMAYQAQKAAEGEAILTGVDLTVPGGIRSTNGSGLIKKKAGRKPKPKAEESDAMDVDQPAKDSAVPSTAATPTATSTVAGEAPGAKKAGRPKKGVVKKPVKKRRRVGEDAEEEDDDYRPSSKTAEAVEEEIEQQKIRVQDSNPLPGHLDAITLEEVVDPAISPYGHVVSYSTWLKTLSKDPKNTCPFTKQPLKKRDLVRLTWENIDEYRDRIIRGS